MIMYRNRGIVSITVIVWYTSTRLSNSIDENGRSEQWRTTGVLRVRRDGGGGHSPSTRPRVVPTYYLNNLSVGGASIL